MNSSSELSQLGPTRKFNLSLGVRLTGVTRAIALIAWVSITLVSLLSFVLSVYSLNVWDRVPAAQASHYFTGMTPEGVQSHANYQDVILHAGLSLAGYALIFTSARILGGLALFILGFLMIRRYSDRLMAVLMAILLSVFAAAGIWNNPLFTWAVGIAPWMKFPAELLAWLLWCGVVVIYAFPDGQVKPRWMFWLAVLVVPIGFLIAFDLNIFLNPSSWPSPLDLLPNILFIGGAFFAIIYRYVRSVDPGQKRRLKWFVLGLSLLLVAYFVDFFISDVYPLSGNLLIQGYQAGMNYVLTYEPIWYALEAFFAIGLGISVFHQKLLED